MKVKLWSNDKKGAEATDTTIKMMAGNNFLERDETQEIKFDEQGNANLITDNEGFMRFALVRQGYIKAFVD